MCKKQVVRDGHWYLRVGLIAALLAAPSITWAQPKEDDDALSEPSSDEGSEAAAQPTDEASPDTPQASVQTAPALHRPPPAARTATSRSCRAFAWPTSS